MHTHTFFVQRSRAQGCGLKILKIAVEREPASFILSFLSSFPPPFASSTSHTLCSSPAISFFIVEARVPVSRSPKRSLLSSTSSVSSFIHLFLIPPPLSFSSFFLRNILIPFFEYGEISPPLFPAFFFFFIKRKGHLRRSVPLLL